MATARIVPVLLAGGGGSRLWPVSRDSLPKQFQPLVGSLSTFQQTLQRVSDPDLFEDPIVITSEAFKSFASRQAGIVDRPVSLILEPCRRDSAAAVAVAALLVEHRRSGSPVLVLAADHVILDDSLFLEAVRSGLEAADDGKIVVFGLPPTAPKTNFGYIRRGAPAGENDDVSLVEAFFEKPTRENAVTYLNEGYLWNSGNFLFRSDVMIEEFARYAPDVLMAARRSIAAAQSGRGIMRLDEPAFSASPKISIDYAVMQKTGNAAVVAGRFRWSDIGSWDAIWEILPHDECGNAALGRGMAIQSRNCLVHSEGILTTVIGGADLVVVATADAVLVCPRERIQEIKGVVERLQGENTREASMHRRDVQSWGYIESAGEGVKRIVVDPEGVVGSRRQMRHSAHWIVIKGTASTIVGGVERTVREGGSLHVPGAAMCELSNFSNVPLEIIEVRTGRGSTSGGDDMHQAAEAVDRSRNLRAVTALVR
ncbi:mannose-1-phosphate guanylyltransferase/mannose-6-phosphate isomerase [Nordella sp. HKS 07]|uniref:mannose-1-phosphate guanylyltransferase/mannose-6-phosphate isomerase n=1 Tax=Nordella sp. HKS 07 TaxID=2712222 RepID=UPI0013E1065C|nr:mannose-1-phosphate guanylyltransferase/mannose-6-phosphate isomerase [Nordella sp. HKS 07]QIG49974.1 mannose-1-phosphate guanylyltransferase/mannose-6-phosphate isomerase [Nordella sp. HKS 07]